MNDEMMKALIADGNKLKTITGEDHGPWFKFPSDMDFEKCAAGTHYIDIDGKVKPKR